MTTVTRALTRNQPLFAIGTGSWQTPGRKPPGSGRRSAKPPDRANRKAAARKRAPTLASASREIQFQERGVLALDGEPGVEAGTRVSAQHRAHSNIRVQPARSFDDGVNVAGVNEQRL
jgi:hypothetical protein